MSSASHSGTARFHSKKKVRRTPFGDACVMPAFSPASNFSPALCRWRVFCLWHLCPFSCSHQTKRQFFFMDRGLRLVPVGHLRVVQFPRRLPPPCPLRLRPSPSKHSPDPLHGVRVRSCVSCRLWRLVTHLANLGTRRWQVEVDLVFHELSLPTCHNGRPIVKTSVFVLHVSSTTRRPKRDHTF